ncbi:MAG: cytochrome c [Chthonomonadales bacterium]|nr:cytochrome c [Chthonomonadales bacterium]
MTRLLAWVGVVGLPIVVITVLWFGRRDFTQPNVVLPTQMAESPAPRPQDPEPDLPDHMALQLAPEGTRSVDAQPFHYGPSLAERKRAGRELVNPTPDSPAVLKNGKRLYETFCLPCHGVGGNGDGPLIPKFPNPPSFRSKQTMALTDGEMFHTITLGLRKMASYASQLEPKERWEVIRYIRTFQKEGKP